MGEVPGTRRDLNVDVELDSEPAAVGRARAAVLPLRDSLSETTYDDLRLVISELVSNSVLHGPGTPIRVTVGIDGQGKVRGEVADDGNGAVAVRRESDAGGHGLMIVDEVAERWGVHEGGTHVWFELSDQL
jgi:two-component sensor histidine kinase